MPFSAILTSRYVALFQDSGINLAHSVQLRPKRHENTELCPTTELQYENF